MCDHVRFIQGKRAVSLSCGFIPTDFSLGFQILGEDLEIGVYSFSLSFAFWYVTLRFRGPVRKFQ